MAFVGSGRFNGRRLRELRVEKGLSQAELGRRIGAHVTSVSDWERGDNAPSGRHAASLTKVFGVEARELYGNADDEEPHQPMSLDDFLRRRVRELLREEVRSA